MGLRPPPNLRSSLMAEPTQSLHFPGWQCPLCFLGAAVLVPLGPCAMTSCPAHSPCVLLPTAEPRIRVNGSHDAEEPLRVTAKAGDEVTLDCEAQGSPPPLVTWTKDFLPVPSVTDR